MLWDLIFVLYSWIYNDQGVVGNKAEGPRERACL